MARWQTILDRVEQAVGDTTDGQVRAWVLDRARRLNAEAEFLTARVTLGATTAGSPTVPLTDQSFLSIEQLRVNGVVYEPVSPEDFWDVSAGRARFLSHVYSQEFDATGVLSLQLHPTPTVTGHIVEARQVIELPEPVSWAQDNPPFPADFDGAVIHGAIALGLAELDEKLNEASWHQDRFTQEIARLKARALTRVRKGPVSVRVPGRY